jgi:RNA polymerase sigma-B factor
MPQARTARHRSRPAAPGGEDERGETLGDSVGRIDDGYARAEDRAVVESLLRSLTTREREVVRLGFGHDLTQAAVGERIGASQMRSRPRAPCGLRQNERGSPRTCSPT